VTGPTDREETRMADSRRIGFDPNLVTLFDSTDPKKIRRFREKLARRAAERGDLAPEALEEWGYLVPDRPAEPSRS